MKNHQNSTKGIWMFKRRDIVLAHVFFSDSSEGKNRPAIILSNEEYHKFDFVLVSSITTANDDYCLLISDKDVNCKLAPESGARFDNIVKLHKKQIIKRIGKVTPEFHGRLIDKVINMLK